MVTVALTLVLLAQPKGCPYPCDVAAWPSGSAPALEHPPLALLDLGTDGRAWGWQTGDGTWVDLTRGKLPKPKRVLSDLTAQPTVRPVLGPVYPIRDDYRAPTPLTGLAWGMTRAEVEAVVKAPADAPVQLRFADTPARVQASFTDSGHLQRLELNLEGKNREQLEALIRPFFRKAPYRRHRDTLQVSDRDTIASITGSTLSFWSTVW
jgi:hypothetical protein